MGILIKMKRRTLDYIAIGIFAVLIVGSLLINFNVSKSAVGKLPENDALVWYKSDDLPEDCRMPEYEDNIEEWKKNLRYNKETWHCLKYFE